MSLPIAVIVHGNQQADAEATILWDNAFSPMVSYYRSQTAINTAFEINVAVIAALQL